MPVEGPSAAGKKCPQGGRDMGAGTKGGNLGSQSYLRAAERANAAAPLAP